MSNCIARIPISSCRKRNSGVFGESVSSGATYDTAAVTVVKNGSPSAIHANPAETLVNPAVSTISPASPCLRFYYYGLRFYNPTLGRWLSRDPIGEVVTILLYSFVENDVLNDVDINGRWGRQMRRPIIKPPKPPPKKDPCTECVEREYSRLDPEWLKLIQDPNRCVVKYKCQKCPPPKDPAEIQPFGHTECNQAKLPWEATVVFFLREGETCPRLHTIIHEITHVVGCCGDKWPLYPDPCKRCLCQEFWAYLVAAPYYPNAPLPIDSYDWAARQAQANCERAGQVGAKCKEGEAASRWDDIKDDCRKNYNPWSIKVE